MKETKATLLMPVEHQVRELDAKLLLACVAAKRGFASVIGPRREMHFRIPSFPKSIYLSKGMANASNNVFHVLKMLGHKIVAWDEEALVHLPPESYYERRISPVAIRLISQLYAWGEDSAELWRQYPQMPKGLPIVVTGNPRGDLLRPEFGKFYKKRVDQIRSTHGDFILINTNFAQVNAFYSDMNLLKSTSGASGNLEMGRRAKRWGVSREYAEGLYRHKQSIFQDFQRLIPVLSNDFPKHSIIVRPHPSENQEIYRKIAAACERVCVTNEGGVVPWIMAAKAMVHNGCTTGVEAYALRVPAIAYRATVNEQYDAAFHHLPNQLSHQCFNIEELRTTLDNIFSGKLGAADRNKRKGLMDHHLAALDGPLACDRIVDALEDLRNWPEEPTPSLRDRLQARLWATKRRVKKRFRGYREDLSHNRAEFQRHCYPDISIEQLRRWVLRFQEVLGLSEQLKVEQIAHQFFRIRT
jgi:surface carbohydrate biosynthesis protein